MNIYIHQNTKLKNFTAVIGALIIALTILFYWKEGFSSQGIRFFYVLFWQFLIWIPCVLIFSLIQNNYKKYQEYIHKKVLIISIVITFLCIHIGWFYLICLNFSPYRNLPDACYGVHSYVFILWIIIDLCLIKYTLGLFHDSIEETITENSKLFELSRGNEKFFCKTNQIFWLRAENYYTKFNTDNGVYLERGALKYFETELPNNDFFRIHRSTIININYLERLVRDKSNNLDVIMKDGSKHRVSRKIAKSLKNFINKKML